MEKRKDSRRYISLIRRLSASELLEAIGHHTLEAAKKIIGGKSKRKKMDEKTRNS